MNTQLPHFVAPLWSAADVLIVTPDGETPPELGANLEEHVEGQVAEQRRRGANVNGTGMWQLNCT